MKQTLNILHLEDSKEDCELVEQFLSNSDLSFKMARIETRDELFHALENENYNLILADCRLPGFSGLHALEISHALRPEIPFIFVSGTIGEETAIESLRNGATDYVLKDRLSRLLPAVQRALAEAEERTLRRQLQQRLHEAGRLEAISTLSNGIAHDFNNILTIIQSHASLLNMQYNQPERVLELTGTITEATRRAADVVQQLLAFARQSDGHVVSTDINRYIQGRLPLLREKLATNLELSFLPAEELPSVLVDHAQLERILVNILANSGDSMPQGGRVTLSSSLVLASERSDLLPQPDSQTDLRPKPASDRYVAVLISDTGVGMDSLTREHLFEPFYTTKDRGRGTGLGMPVVYGLMQAHHGYIDVASEPGVGTTISLFFPVPVLPAAKPVKGLPPGLDPALCGTETILIVEDESDVCFFLETIFQSHGYKILCALNHDAALELFHSHKDEIRLVFSDIGLPKIDGITLCTELKGLNPDLYIILTSGYALKEYKSRMEQLGNHAFLAKPYQTHDILQTTRKVLDGTAVFPLG